MKNAQFYRIGILVQSHVRVASLWGAINEGRLFVIFNLAFNS